LFSLEADDHFLLLAHFLIRFLIHRLQRLKLDDFDRHPLSALLRKRQ